MAKCFITGVEIPIEDAHLLDIKAAKIAVLNLRKRLRAVEGLLKQFGAKDEWEYYDYKNEKKITRHDRRLVCKTVALLNSCAYPEAQLFISWPEYRARRPVLIQQAEQPSADEAQ